MACVDNALFSQQAAHTHKAIAAAVAWAAAAPRVPAQTLGDRELVPASEQVEAPASVRVARAVRAQVQWERVARGAAFTTIHNLEATSDGLATSHETPTSDGMPMSDGIATSHVMANVSPGALRSAETTLRVAIGLRAATKDAPLTMRVPTEVANLPVAETAVARPSVKGLRAATSLNTGAASASAASGTANGCT
jgi:hypothetical protein